MGPEMRQVFGIGDCPTEMGSFGVDIGHPIVTNQTFWRICAKVHETLELLFGWLVGLAQVLVY